MLLITSNHIHLCILYKFFLFSKCFFYFVIVIRRESKGDRSITTHIAQQLLLLTHVVHECFITFGICFFHITPTPTSTSTSTSLTTSVHTAIGRSSIQFFVFFVFFWHFSCALFVLFLHYQLIIWIAHISPLKTTFSSVSASGFIQFSFLFVGTKMRSDVFPSEAFSLMLVSAILKNSLLSFSSLVSVILKMCLCSWICSSTFFFRLEFSMDIVRI